MLDHPLGQGVVSNATSAFLSLQLCLNVWQADECMGQKHYAR